MCLPLFPLFFPLARYLDRKKLKKKNKLTQGKPGDPTVLEQTLLAKGRVQFGERVDAPLEVNLKRKHWAQDKEKKASERCKVRASASPSPFFYISFPHT
jgi:hypothetical protein